MDNIIAWRAALNTNLTGVFAFHGPPTQPQTTDLGLVGLDRSASGVRSGRTIAFVIVCRPGPGRLVAAEAHVALELHGRDGAFTRAHHVDDEEPLG